MGKGNVRLSQVSFANLFFLDRLELTIQTDVDPTNVVQILLLDLYFKYRYCALFDQLRISNTPNHKRLLYSFILV